MKRSKERKEMEIVWLIDPSAFFSVFLSLFIYFDPVVTTENGDRMDDSSITLTFIAFCLYCKWQVFVDGLCLLRGDNSYFR